MPRTWCVQCGKENPLPKRGAVRRFCSAACREKAKETAERYNAVCEFCGDPFRCARARQRFCSLSCVTSHKNAVRYADHVYVPQGKGHRGRAQRYGVRYEVFAARDVFERDGWACGLCEGDVDPKVAWPDPWSASLDHVVPMSRGGDHVLENVQCAHLRCNIVKGASLDAGTSAQAC
ncbi:HNH endonuclease [Streptomyces sp. MUM 16J]|uniref:HNH endonuclease n=1 Tax=Streptomyces sp. MUM 16J TaxID=2791988 RepID=UPI001F03A015|nr:HNH endonuclease [Streptomyces sp. MUM 16J]MCH0555804.1 HNH endonuclease [Streptomyces sp. MUM 16J]